MAEALYADVLRFAGFGEHRTASPADHETSRWFCDALRAAGVSAALDPWPLRQFQLEQCWIGAYGQRMDAFPLWHPVSAGTRPLRGRPVPPEGDVDGKIVLARFEDVMVTPKSDHDGIITDLATRGARAILGCTPHASGEIYGQNVIPPRNQSPWPIPVAMIAPKHWHVFHHAVCHGDEIEFLLSGQDEPQAQAMNVVGRLERGARWIIVSTPQSGWFRCAGERGAGVALLLELARWASRSTQPQSFLFLSNSGHEIGHMGIHHLFEKDVLPPPEVTDCWLHLGSSIGTYGYDQEGPMLIANGPEPESWLYSSADLLEHAKKAFAELPHLEPAAYDRKSGEIRWILERGYPGMALMGPQRFFHLKDDGPEVVDPQLLARIASALVRTIEAFDGEERD